MKIQTYKLLNVLFIIILLIYIINTNMKRKTIVNPSNNSVNNPTDDSSNTYNRLDTILKILIITTFILIKLGGIIMPKQIDANFNYNEEVKKCKTIDDIMGKDGLIQRLVKDVLENMLEGEMEETNISVLKLVNLLKKL